MELHPDWWEHCPSCPVVSLSLFILMEWPCPCCPCHRSARTSRFPLWSDFSLYCCGGYSILGEVWHHIIHLPVLWIGIVVWLICTYPFRPEVWVHFSMFIKSTPLSQVVWFVQTKSCILPYHHQVYLVLILSWRNEWSNLQQKLDVQVVTFSLSYTAILMFSWIALERLIVHLSCQDECWSYFCCWLKKMHRIVPSHFPLLWC